jgi:hypothetical protein
MVDPSGQAATHRLENDAAPIMLGSAARNVTNFLAETKVPATGPLHA